MVRFLAVLPAALPLYLMLAPGLGRLSLMRRKPSI